MTNRRPEPTTCSTSTQRSSQIRDILRAEIGHEVHPNTIAYYDPSRSPRLSRRLKLYASEVRKAYVEGTKDVAIAHQAHRLRKYEAICESATKSKDYNAALKALELAAKEMGGVLEGRTVVRHEGAVSHIHGTVEDARQEVAMRLASLLDSGLLPSPAPAPQAPIEGEIVQHNQGDTPSP